jgi:trehalose 6-phosphate phosphatase
MPARGGSAGSLKPFERNFFWTLRVLMDSLDLRNCAVLLDVDGTIVDIAPTPHSVVVTDELLGVLERIRETAGGALALVSGRPIADLDLLFEPLRLAAIGGHGAEIRFDPVKSEYEQRGLTLERDMKQALLEIADRYAGVATEDKGFSVALHYRLALERGLDVVNDVVRLCARYVPGTYEILQGKAVIEVKTVGFNKGTAVRELMACPPFAGRIPVFLGDDVTDETVFAVIPEYAGISISVGRMVPGADAMFHTPADVRKWLTRLSATAAAAT